MSEVMKLCFDDSMNIAVELVNPDGTIVTKNISLPTLRKCFGESLEVSGRASFGFLPPCIVYCAYDYDKEKEFKTYVIEYNEPCEDITYWNTTYSQFPLPRLIFSFQVSGDDGKVSHVKIGVIPLEQKITEETPMFYYPFSNIYTSGLFTMCTGQNSLYLKQAADLKRLAQFILRCPNNDDFYKCKRNRPGLEHRDLMEALKDKDQQYYYENILIPIPKKTVKDFLKE